MIVGHDDGILVVGQGSIPYEPVFVLVSVQRRALHRRDLLGCLLRRGRQVLDKRIDHGIMRVGLANVVQ
jgi:hypothetical protein